MTTNLLKLNYQSLDKPDRVTYRKKLIELCGWDCEATFYRKMKDDYKPSQIEKLASKMAFDSITPKNK